MIIIFSQGLIFESISIYINIINFIVNILTIRALKEKDTKKNQMNRGTN